MALVYACYVPNAPFLISPAAFEGVGAEAVETLRGLHAEDRIRGGRVVVSSPHWLTRPGFLVNTSPRPRQIYDFSGFPPSLSSVRYEPPGEPDLGGALVAAARGAGIEIRGTQEWGLDHGAWAPLMHLVPDAMLPVVPISISNLSPESHVALGRAIRPVIESGPQPVAFVATGSITHDFDRFDPRPGARWPEGERIEGEILDLLRTRNDEGLLNFDRAKWNTIKPEGNLGPLFTLLGAVGPDVRPRIVSRGSVMGGFGMSILEFLPG